MDDLVQLPEGREIVGVGRLDSPDVQWEVVDQNDQAIEIRGAKKGGGGDSKAGVEERDSLHSISYANVVCLLSEGEIQGLANGLRSVLINGTPLQNADGGWNFQNVEVETRTGTQFQDPITGSGGAEEEVGIGAVVTDTQPFTWSLGNPQLTRARVRVSVDSLSRLDVETGNLGGYRIDYAIDLSTDGGAWQTVLATAFDGKTTQQYQRSHAITLPRATSGWMLRIRRITAQANSQLIQDTMRIQSITSIVDALLRYPMSAIVRIKVDARQFNGMPQIAFDAIGRIIRVPSNYDPAARTYSGIWDGTFKPAWTNNPAWIFLDLVTNDRYGLGKQIPLAMVDKWSLYRIAQYCDQQVDDGRGGLEPRFVCNVYLQQRADAWRVLQDLASVFRGIAYYAAGAVAVAADLPVDPVYTYTAANVIEGRFSYQGPPRRTRPTMVLVSWSDQTDMGRQKIEKVEDRAAIARFGIRQVEITAFGCTSQAQAHRVGKWALLTAKLERDVVTFGVGLDGAIAIPGQVVRISDPKRAGRRVGGRIRTATTTAVETDAEVVVRPGDRLTVMLPTGVSETRTVTDAVGQRLTIDSDTITIDQDIGVNAVSADSTLLTLDSEDVRLDATSMGTASPIGGTRPITLDMTGLPGTTMTVTVSPPFSQAPTSGAVWTIESEQLFAQQYRVTSVSERSRGIYDITAVEHQPGKFDNIDYGTIIQPRPISIIPPAVQAAPSSITLSARYVVEQGIANAVMTIQWSAAPNAVAYEVEWRRSGGEWVRAGRTGSTSVEVRGIYRGRYVARVRAINVLDAISIPAVSAETELDGKTTPPPQVTHLTATGKVFGIQVRWGFPAGSELDVERTELWYSATNLITDATKLADLAYPQADYTMNGLAAGVEFWFWARLVDRTGNVGAFYPAAAGAYGQSSTSASEILAYLTGQITRTQLGQALLTQIDTTAASAVEVQEIKTDLAAMYTIKTQLTANGRRYVAGIGVGVENNSGQVESQVLVAASRFAVVDPNGNTVSVPFVVQGGQVFIDSAFIQNASITDAKIVSLAASKIVASALDAISANLGTVTAGVIRNSIDTFRIDLNAAFGGEVVGVGSPMNYGRYGARKPFSLTNNGSLSAAFVTRAHLTAFASGIANAPSDITVQFATTASPPPAGGS